MVTLNSPRYCPLIRLMTADGLYPNTAFLTKNAAYFPDKMRDLVWSIVTPNQDDDYFDEQQWADRSEIRLWATLALTIPGDQGMVLFCPSDLPVMTSNDLAIKKALSAKSSVEEVSRFLSAKLSGLDLGRDYREYVFHSFKFDQELFLTLYQSIDPADALLMRGLSCLIKSPLLSRKHLFLHEATILVYISMEAALRIILRSLRARGISEPTFQMVYDEIISKVPRGDGLADFLQECWGNRIMVIHPESRVGTFFNPPLLAEEPLVLYKILVDLYRYLLIGAEPSYI